MSTAWLTHILLVASLLIASAQSNCYFPNGTDANRLDPSNPQYLPCNGGDPVSMCCHVNDECRSDGLCKSTWFDGNIWRDMCTDPTWQSPSCIKLCVVGVMKHAYASNPPQRDATAVTLTPCGDGSYCCNNGTAAHECCSSGEGMFVDKNGEPVQDNPSGTASPSAATSASKTLAPTAASHPLKKKNHAGVIVGAVIAMVIVLAAIGVGAVAVIRKRRRYREASAHGEAMRKKYAELSNNELGEIAGTEGRHKAEPSTARYQSNVELDGRPRYEMPHEPAHERGQRPVGRQELGSTKHQ